MKILVTGSKGFIGKNLVENLKTVMDGRNKRPFVIDAIYEYDIDSSMDELREYCRDCDFVYNFAGINRPKNTAEFDINRSFLAEMLNLLAEAGNKAPVMLASSIQADLDNDYGKSKKAAEELLFRYGKENDVRVLVYRFPNVFGKWCRPNYNSAIATFCNNIAHDLPIQVNDRSVEMELLYIDDLVDELINSLKGEGSRCEFDGVETVPTADGRYYYVPVTHKTTLGEIVDIIQECADAAANKDGINMINLTQGSLRYKLMTTYLSYLPKEKAIYDHKMNVDPRGSFTELLHTLTHGQVSINISKPGITKGEHWHNSKFEYFTVVSGHGLIQLRNEADPNAEILNYEVSGDKIQSVIMLPGYTHNIINLSDTQDLVTVMYCNEIFNPGRPDTYFDPVDNNK